jgi:ABC-type nitrate/sulfonate/bicarbonate transport system permease component
MNGFGRRIIRTPVFGLVLVMALLLLWQLTGVNGWISPLSLPPFGAVLRTLWRLSVSGEIPSELSSSLARMFAGYFIGVTLGVVIGVPMGSFRPVYSLLEPITEILRPIPSPAYVPIAILFLGIDDGMKIFMIAFSAFFPVLLNTYSGVRGVDPVQLQTANTFGVRGIRLLWQIVLPSAAPVIFVGLRVSLAVALIVMVIAEMVASSNGIGYFILAAERGFQIKEMYAGVITLAIVGYALNRAFLAVENRVLAWHQGFTQQQKN